MLVEDDYQLSMSIKESLERYQYKVIEPESFFNIEGEFTRIQPDLVLLDINLPYFDGYYLCRAIRQQSNVPILMISARKEDIEQIRAIELGADDYLTKPFTIDMLVTKIKATIRRIYGEYAEKEQHHIWVGDLFLNVNTMEIAYQNKTLGLSKNEFKLLKKLMTHADSVVSREDLIEEVWDDMTFVEDNTLTVNIAKIKHILEELNLQDVLKNKRGIGYIMDSSNIVRR